MARLFERFPSLTCRLVHRVHRVTPALARASFGPSRWDGRSDMPLACGEGTDHDAGEDAALTKAVLVDACCDPAVREPFIAALSGGGGECDRWPTSCSSAGTTLVAPR